MMILTPTNGSINNYVRCMRRKNEPYVPISVCEKCHRRGECKDYHNHILKNPKGKQ